MTLRDATRGDAPMISSIHAKSWKAAYVDIVPQAYLDTLPEGFWTAAFVDWLGSGRFRAKLLCDGADAVGCVTYGRSRDEKLPGWGEIVSIYLLPGCFGTGGGQMLLQSALADLRQDGFTEVFLWMIEKNARAQRFYEKNGFTWSGETLSFTIEGKELAELRYCYSAERRST